MELQPHQKRAVAKINKTNRQLLYHGLGSGKTLTGLSAKEGKTVVVTPASLRSNITDTLSKFKLPKKGISVYSYEGATKLKPKGDTLIVDEAHRLGDPTSSRSQALRDMAKGYNRVILLSGSPIRNKPHEIAPLANMLGVDNKDIPITESDFNRKYIGKKRDKRTFLEFIRGIKPGTITYIKNKDKLRKVLGSKVDYYMPEKTNYPDKIEVTHIVPMSDSQHKLYKALVHKTDSAVVYKVGNDKPMTAAEKSKANTFMSAARILSNSEKPFGGKAITPKVKKIVENIKDKKKEKHMVYSSFLDGGINVVADELSKKGLKPIVFHGGMNDKEKKLAVDTFNKKKSSVLLISGAGAEGIDLKGTRHIHIMEPHWNKSRIDQVIGRGARFKSHDHLPKKERNVTVHHYQSVLPNSSIGIFDKLLGKKKPKLSADQYMTNLANRKEKLNQDFLDTIR